MKCVAHCGEFTDKMSQSARMGDSHLRAIAIAERCVEPVKEASRPVRFTTYGIVPTTHKLGML